MNGHRLTPRAGLGTLRIDLRGVLPTTLAALSPAEVERLPIGIGRALVPLAEALVIEAFDAETPTLHLAGDCARVDHIGWQLDGGAVIVDGPAGDQLGGAMCAGTVRVHGDAGDQTGIEMAGGVLHVDGSVGHHAASTLPGSMDGMRGGLLIVGGAAGDRLADRLRRGTVIVGGDVGAYAASRLVAGSVVIGGGVSGDVPSAHPAYGQRRGSLLWLDVQAAPAPSPITHVPAHAGAPVFWQLFARDLARLGAEHLASHPIAERLAALPRQTIRRWLGDLAVDGKGEWIVPG